MGFIHQTGYVIPSNGASSGYCRINECYLSKPLKEASFLLGYYANKQSAIDGLEPIVLSGKYYINAGSFDEVFPNGEPYEANLYAYIATNILAGQGWESDTP